MASVECDVFVHWELDHRGRILGFQGKKDYHPLATTRLLMRGPRTDFAEAGDVLVVGRAPFLTRGDVGGIANATRDTLLRASPVLAAVALGLPVAAITWLLSRFGGRLPFITIPAFLALVGFGRLIDAGTSAKRGAAAYRAEVERRQAIAVATRRHSPPPPPPPPPPSVEEREARLAAAYAGNLPGAEWHPLGTVKVADGLLVTSDAFDLSEAGGREIPLRPGTYPVSVAVVTFGPELHSLESLAYAALRLSDEPVVRWEAMIDGQGEPLDIAIDSATASFASRDSRRKLAAHFGCGEHHSAEFEHAMMPVYENGWALLETDGAQLAAFQTGDGDGSYPVYRGLDAEGRPVAIVLDFKIY
jgi:hypothetical protein